MKRIALFLAAAAFLFLVLAARSQSPLPAWVSITPAQDCSHGCWRVVEAEYLDPIQSQGLHHFFARTLDAQGNQIVGRMNIAWDGGSTGVQTKPPPDWGDIPLFSCFSPTEGEIGGYRGFAGEWEANSDLVVGMGLPECQHVSYRVTFRWDNGGGTATPTSLPTVTPAPTAAPAHRLALPMVRK